MLVGATGPHMPCDTWGWASTAYPSISQQCALGEKLMHWERPTHQGRDTEPEDRERLVRRKQFNKYSILPLEESMAGHMGINGAH
jgi:hypothetical protein